MVSPVTGPFSKTIYWKGPPNSLGYRPVHTSVYRKWYRQRKPHNLPLNFELDYRAVERFYASDPVMYRSYTNSVSWDDSTTLDWAYLKAYEKFKSKVKSSEAMLSVSLAERKQAVDMIEKRSLQIYRFVRSLKRFRFDEAADALGISRSKRPKDLRQSARSLGSNYLEFHFGWSPLIGDIGNAVETLQSGIPPLKVSAKGSASRSFKETTGIYWYDQTYWTHSVSSDVRIASAVRVTNPNLFLANQLGFVNPAMVAWELVPFSFVVDWFVSVSDFLGSFSDFLGVELIDPYVTRFVNHRRSELNVYKDSRTGNIIRVLECDTRRVHLRRTPGPIPGPALRVRPITGFSVRRGFAAMSLLLQQLRK